MVPWLVTVAILLGVAAFLLFGFKPVLDDRDGLRAELAELRERMAALEKERDALTADGEQLQKDLAALQASKDALAAEVEEREAQIEELRKAREELEQKLAADIASGHVTVRGEGNMLAVDLADEILFPSGEAELRDRGKEVIRRVCPSLRDLEGRIVEVGGHTDDRPIVGDGRERFPTNWELSTARATDVVRFLQDECDISGTRLVAAGFSAYRPVASNRSRRGRSKNRRIELVLRPPPPSRKK